MERLLDILNELSKNIKSEIESILLFAKIKRSEIVEIETKSDMNFSLLTTRVVLDEIEDSRALCSFIEKAFIPQLEKILNKISTISEELKNSQNLDVKEKEVELAIREYSKERLRLVTFRERLAYERSRDIASCGFGIIIDQSDLLEWKKLSKDWLFKEKVLVRTKWSNWISCEMFLSASGTLLLKGSEKVLVETEIKNFHLKHKGEKSIKMKKINPSLIEYLFGVSDILVEFAEKDAMARLLQRIQ